METDTKASAPPSCPPPPPYSANFGPAPGFSGPPGEYHQQPAYPGYPGYPQQAYPQHPYPGQPGYPQVPPNLGQPTVVVQAPVLTGYNRGFREIPISTTCPGCGTSIITRTEFEAGVLTWILCIVIFTFGLFLGCCLIPFCINGLKDVVHTCPNCQCVVAKYNRI